MSARHASLLSANAADPLASVRMDVTAIADLAFGDMSVEASQFEGRHLAMLATESLELDLNDPVQRQFGDYELKELIGEGGMGVVYRAHQASLDRDVAVKLLAAGPWASKSFIERFRREAQNAARMQHPNIVAIYEVGSAEELHFFSMRLIRGGSLADLLQREGALPALRAAQLLRVIAEAVDYAHRLGVLHLDLKPANVLLDDNGAPHVADFGLARRLEQGMAADNNEVSGTPSYMAPEQATAGAQKITPATDIWGLGAILYELATGHPPYLGTTPQETLKLVVEGKLTCPRTYTRDLPLDLSAIIHKCMEYKVADRYATARALADDLAAFCEGRPVKARPLNTLQRIARFGRREPKLAAMAILALAALLIGLLATTQQWRRAEAERHLAQEQKQLAETNAATSRQRLWEGRRDSALRLMQDGKGFEALSPLIANIEEQEQAGKSDPQSIERHEIGMIENQGVTLIGRMIVPDANPMATALSPDGSLLAVGLNDISVRWYDTTTLAERGRVDLSDLPTSDGNPRVPQWLHFIDNHRLSVTLEWYTYQAAPGGGDTALVDLDRARIVEPPSAFADLAHVTWSPDGRHAMLYSANRGRQYWQADPWQPLSAFTQMGREATEDQPVWMLRNPRFSLQPTGSESTIKPFDVHLPGALQAPLKLPPSNSFSAWAESSDGATLALGDGGGRVFLVDLATRAARKLPMPAGRDVTWLAFSNDDAWLAAARRDGAAFAFDVGTGALLNSGQMQHDVALSYVAVDHSSRLLIAAGEGETTLWRLPKPGPIAAAATRVLSGPTRAARSGPYWMSEALAVGLLATADMDGEVRLWRLPVSQELPAHSSQLVSDRLFFDGNHVADVAYNHVRVASVTGTASTAWIDQPPPVDFTDLVDHGKTLIIIARHTLQALAADTLEPRYSSVSLRGDPQYMALSADGRTTVLAFNESNASGFHQRLESYDAMSGKLRDAGVTLNAPLRQLELSPDTKWLLATGPARDATRVFDATTLQRVGEYPHDPDQPVLWASFTADSKQLWLVTRPLDETQANDAELIRWDPRKGEVRERRQVHGVWPVGVATVGDKPLLAARDRLVLDPGAADERVAAGLFGAESTTVFGFSHDGRFIAHAVGREVQMYDATTLARVGPPLQTDLNPMEAIQQLAFADDDRHLLCRTMQHYLLLWPLSADARSARELRADAELLTPAAAGQRVLRMADSEEHRRLRRLDPGPWRVQEPRPAPAVARMIAGTPLPARGADTNPLLLDLTAFYKMTPDGQYNMIETVLPGTGAIPFGVVRLDGVDYDLRGRLELRSGSGGSTGSQQEVRMEPQAKGIPVPPVPIAALHILLYAPLPTPQSAERIYASVRLHYRDGSQALLPIRTQREVPGWTDHDRPVPVGWVQGNHLRFIGEWHQELISDPRLPNPHPEKLIATLDLETNSNYWSVPVFLAITAEPFEKPKGGSVIAAPNSGSNMVQGGVK